MSVSKVSIHNLRIYALESFSVDPKITVILGKNGTGKTSILESIYMLLRGTSFRGRDRDVIAHNARTAEIKLELGDELRRLKLRVGMNDKIEKEFTVEGKTSARLPIKLRKPVILFEPDELRMLSSSPQRRRQFIDDVISRLHPAYATILNRYQRILLQRNELLKQIETIPLETWESQLFVWDMKFAEMAELVVRERLKFIERSNQRLSAIYSSLAGVQHTVHVDYTSQLDIATYKQALLSAIHASRKGDAYRGFTTHGPHREDLTIYLDTFPASETASRGEMRTIMLAYKLLEVELQEEITGEQPIILMDDVFSELDLSREQALMRALQPYQTIITATDLREELKINASVITL